MSNRVATDTIRGYFYQFDYTIKRIIECSRPSDIFTVEGIEDIDITSFSEEMAIQCKYYSKTEYNHSVIAKPIRKMLSHFMSEKKKGIISKRYKLYGYFKGGQDKLRIPIKVEDLKENFLTYIERGIQKAHYDTVKACDSDLVEFITKLDIDVYAQEYQAQLESIMNQLKHIFSCTAFEAEHFYYNNALNVIKELATESDISKRQITKKIFLVKINSRNILFNHWFIEFKGLNKHFRELRAQYFTSLSISPFERFFLIGFDKAQYSRTNLKEMILVISKKWTRISKRETNPFCPYIHINDIGNRELIDLKKELLNEGHKLIDGYSFKGAHFNSNTLQMEPNYYNGISIKFLNKLDHLDKVLSESKKTKEIYQFYQSSPFYVNDSVDLKHIKIQVPEIKNIKDII